MSTRPSWDDYYMTLARAVATRATCDRKHVGAVIVRDQQVLATGYNGSIRGLEHCGEAGHLMEDGHCVRTIHAEANAILQAARHGVSIQGATIYVTASPCWPCFGLLANVGVVRIVFGEAYRAEDPGPRRVREYAARLKIELVGSVFSAASFDTDRIDLHRGPHTDCLDPSLCACECQVCRRAWNTAGHPTPQE